MVHALEEFDGCTREELYETVQGMQGVETDLGLEGVTFGSGDPEYPYFITEMASMQFNDHRAVEFRKFLTAIDKAVPAELEVHLVCDNLATHKTETIRRWLARHPRFRLHFTPTGSSWLNLVERWFAEITMKLIRRGVHRSVKHLKTADAIGESLAAYCQRISDSGH